MPFKTMSEVKAANTAAGMCWFSRQTMKFWHSKIESGLLKGRYFITSEDSFAIDGRTPERIFAVREVQPDANIKTLESFLRSKQEAKDFIGKLEVK